MPLLICEVLKPVILCNIAGGLDERLQGILDLAQHTDTPVVFALSLKKLGQVFGQRKKISAVAVLDVNGANELAAEMLRLADAGREEHQTVQASRSASAAAATAAEPTSPVHELPPPAPVVTAPRLNVAAAAFVPSWL
jgi:hypothetical protein